MKSFTILAFIVSFLGVVVADSAETQGKKGANQGPLELEKLLKILNSGKENAGDTKRDVSSKKPDSKGKAKKQDIVENPDGADSENAASETIQAAGNYNGDYDSGYENNQYHTRRHRNHRDLYRRTEETEEAEVGSKYVRKNRRNGRTHRRQNLGYISNDSDCSESDFGKNRSHKRHSLYRRAEEAEEAEVNNKHGSHGQRGQRRHRRHSRGYGSDDSDCSDSNQGYGSRRHNGRRGLYRRAEEAELFNNYGRHGRRGIRRYKPFGRGYGTDDLDYYDSDRGFNSDCSSYSDNNSSDSNEEFPEEKPVEAAPAATKP